MRKTSFVLIIFLGVFLLRSFPASAETDPGKYVGRYVVLKPGYLIADSKRSFLEAADLRKENKEKEIEELRDKKHISFTKGDEKVYVIHIRPAIGAARIKNEKGGPVLWADIEALSQE